MTFCVWLLSVSILFLSFLHIVAFISTSFYGQIIFQCMYMPQFVHLLYLFCFHFGAIVNNVSVNIHVQVLCLSACFQLLGGYIHLGVELLGHMIILRVKF